ncbi:DUF7344 domain-containing protein [Halorubrum vacuolatum]|nr:hypothetical protein [Halorubrum vacuolatum]
METNHTTVEGSVGIETEVDTVIGRSSLSRDDVFEALSNGRRRCALFYLQEQSAPVALSELVDHVTAWQYDQPLTNLNPSDRMCIYSALRQVHLPYLDATGFVEYDREAGMITVTDAARYAKLYLEYDPGNDIPWSWLYAGLVAIGAILGGASYLGTYPFDWLGGHLVIAILLGVFGTAAFGHLLYEHRNRRSAADLFGVER